MTAPDYHGDRAPITQACPRCEDQARKLEAIKSLCRRYDVPGMTWVAKALARRILRMLEKLET